VICRLKTRLVERIKADIDRQLRGNIRIHSNIGAVWSDMFNAVHAEAV
jgi:hypothetical protein